MMLELSRANQVCDPSQLRAAAGAGEASEDNVIIHMKCRVDLEEEIVDVLYQEYVSLYEESTAVEELLVILLLQEVLLRSLQDS